MAETKDTAFAAASQTGTRGGGGFELRLERGAVHVRLADQPIAPGVRLELLTLNVPDVKFPFEVGRGAGQFRHRLADLVELSVALEPSAVEAALAGAGLAAFGLEDVRLAPRDGFAEIAGRLSGGPPFTLEAGLLPAGDQRVAIVLHAPRVLGVPPLPAAALPHLARSVLDALGPEELPPAPLPALLRRVLAPRGWKLPRTGGVRLARATVAGGVARLCWDSAASSPAVASADPDLLAADEGARTFRDAEALLARGQHDAARDAYLAAGAAAAAHPFAAERLLSLLVQEERFHEEALDLAAEWLSRRPGFEPALVAEGAIRAARGEGGRAAAAFSALAKGAAARGRVFLALAAAEAALDAPGAPDEERLRAVDVALGLRRDHLPALRALRDLSRARGDREGLLRACRRLVAYEPAPADKARAHADLGQLLLDADPAGARLHLDQALRLGPDDVTAQAALARACAAAGEPLRAVRALDRVRELLVARGDRAGAARAALDAGALWEGPLSHAENALLRYRDASELAPSADTTARAARAAEAAGQWAEAADLHAATLAALDPAAPGAAELAFRTRLALADVAERRLGDAAGAAAHLAQAAALAPADAPLLRRLAGLERTLGRRPDLLRTLDRLAQREPEGAARAGLLAEAGEVALALGLAGDARSRFTAAIAADPACRPALLGAARLANERGDAPAERDALEKLLAISSAAPAAEAADVLDRLASARDRSGDLGGAAAAAAAARAALPTPARLEACVALARRAGDPGALAALLAEHARAAAAAGDAHAAAEAWLERARLLAATPAEALAALAEARAISPGDARVLRAQADLAERTGDARLALGCLRALLAGAPEDGPALDLRAARAAVAAGEIPAAKDHAERALSRDVPGAAELLDEILARAGDDAARADVLGRLGRHLEAARLLERHGDPAGARAALERAAADPAAATRALPRLAELRLDAGDRVGAAAALLALARLGQGRDAARTALQAWSIGRDPAALDLAISRDPRFGPPLARRAALRATDAPRAALSDAEAALAADGLADDERPELLALAARTAAAIGDGAGARRHLAAYCEVVPDDDPALERLAALHRAAGARAELAAVLERRVALARGPAALGVRLELSDLLAASDPARACRVALEALTCDPASVDALRALTTPPRAAHLPAPERAALLARLARTATATPAEAAAAHAARARLLHEAGDDAAALVAVHEAARLGEEPDDVLELRALVAERCGEAAEAAGAHLERARRAEARGEPHAAERLADAGLRALAAGTEGGEAALSAALALDPERETARAALEALARLARERGDAARERELLPRLVPLLPTGARPAALLRLSALALEAKELAVARASAQEAHALAPRELAPIEACRAAALAAGDLEEVAELLGEAAALDPAGAGQRLLDRARLLAALRRAADADDAFVAALAALPPDRALADEHARLRRDALPARPVAAPIEAFALRCADPAEAATALRAAAALALAGDDLGAALRCARGAWARTEGDPGFAGPLLARVLYLLGSVSEAVVVHRRLLDAGVATVAADDVVAICRQAADVAEAFGDRDLARRALDELLRLRPQEVEAAVARFELDPDRARAIRALADAAGGARSRRRRVLALCVAAEAALVELHDPTQADALFARARAEAGPSPRLTLVVARRRTDAVRRSEGASSGAHLAALHEAAAAAEAAADRGAARDLLEEAIQRQRERGLFADAAQDLLQLDALAAAEGDFAESPGRLRAAASLLREAGDVAGAAEVLRIAWTANPDSEETARRLEEALRERGPGAARELAEVLEERVRRAPGGEERAAALVLLAAARADAGDAAAEEAALRDALGEVPGHAAAENRLLALLDTSRRTGERARLLLERSARVPDEPTRAALRREAARALAASADPDDRDLAAEAWRVVAAASPGDLEAARAAAGLLLGLGRREDAVPHLEALVHADPGDDAAAGELSIAYADRPAQRAELFLARASCAHGERRAEHLREAAGALFACGEAERARAALREAFDTWPADSAAFEEAVRDASRDVDRLDAVLATRARAVPAEAATCHKARGDALRSAGRSADAVVAYEAARDADGDDVGVIVALAATLAEARGDAAAADLDHALIARAETSPADVPPAAEAQARYRVGLALSFAGGSAEAVPHLERALALAPHDGHAGLGWAAVAQGYADRGDAASALAAARARAERAASLGLETERAAALEAEAELADRFGLPSALGPASIELPPALEAHLPERSDALHAPEDAAPPPSFLLAPDEPAEEPVSFAPPPEEPVAEEPFSFGAPPAPPSEEAFSFLAPPEPAPEEPISFLAPPEPAPEEPMSFLAPPAHGEPEESFASVVTPEPGAGVPAPEEPAEERSEEPVSFLAPQRDDAEPEESFAFDAPPEEPASGESEEAVSFVEALAGGAGEAPVTFEPAPPEDPASRVSGWLASALTLARSGASADEVRAALDSACDVDPDAPQPWRERAHLEEEIGDPLGAARSYLAVWLRSEGEDAAEAALAAARLFEAEGFHADAARAYRGALHVRPGIVPAAYVVAADALAESDFGAAATHLSAVDPELLPDALRIPHARKLATALAGAGKLEQARDALEEALERDPSDPVTSEALAALDARTAEWSALAAVEAAEGAQALDGAEGAARYLHAATLLRDRAGDTAGAIAALRAALARARSSEVPAARKIVEDASAMLRDLGAPLPALTPVALRAEALAPAAPEPAAEASPLAPGEAAAPAPEPTADLAPPPPTEAAAPPPELEAEPAAAPLPELTAEPAPEAAAAPLLELAPEPASEPLVAPPPEPAEPAEGAAPAIEPAPAEDAAPGARLTSAAASQAPAGAARAAALEGLASDRVAAGDTAGAIDALVAALEADPGRSGTHDWLVALSGGDEEVLARAEAARGTWIAPPEPTPWLPHADEPETTGEISFGTLASDGLEPDPDLQEPETGDFAFDTLESSGVGAEPSAPAAEPAVPDLQEPETGEIAFDALESSGLDEAPAPAVDAQAVGREGRALMQQGDWEGAHAKLSVALQGEPSDLTLARDLSRVAEKLRRWDEYVALGEVCADAISAYDPLAAAARYRHFAEVLREKVGSVDRAAAMLEKALTMVPEDPDTRRALVAAWSEQPATAPRALEAWLELARKEPTDAEAVAGVARVAGQVAAGAPGADALRLGELARVAAGLVAFVAPATHPPPPPARLAAQVPAELRARVAAPGSTGALARILEKLAPWLEMLFPADLKRRGVGPDDRLDPQRAPTLATALDAAAAALSARPVTKYLLDRPSMEIALENTQPPSIVLTQGVAVLDDEALSFLAARTLDLVSHGSTLLGKFAPRDVGILLELACRFAGGQPPSLGLPEQRAGAFLQVLGQAVPGAVLEAVRPLGAAAAQELAETDPRAFAAALRRTANRVGLLYSGDPGPALRALALVDRRLAGGPVDPAQALTVPDLRDLALFSLSEPFLELRTAVLG